MKKEQIITLAKANGFHNFEQMYNDCSEMTYIYHREQTEHKEAMEAIEKAIKELEYVTKDTVSELAMRTIIKQMEEQVSIIDKELERIENAWAETSDIILSLDDMDEHTYYTERF